MVTPFKRLGGKEELDARIAGFSRQRGRVDGEAPGETTDAPAAVGAAPTLPNRSCPGSRYRPCNGKPETFLSGIRISGQVSRW